MRHNVYAAPLANLDDEPRIDVDDHFYVVSPRKMLLLFFFTVGLYQLYWNFLNWSNHKHNTGDRVWPLPRALFSVFFTHSLYHNIGDHDVTGKRGGWDSGSYAAAMVFLLVVGYVLSWTGGDSRFFNFLSVLLLIPIGLVMKQVQLEINARCGDADGASNDNFTVANFVWCVLGGLLWLLVVVGLLVPRQSGL